MRESAKMDFPRPCFPFHRGKWEAWAGEASGQWPLSTVLSCLQARRESADELGPELVLGPQSGPAELIRAGV